MNPTNANSAEKKIVNLYDCDKQAASQQLEQSIPPANLLETIMVNPRFSKPANDEDQLSDKEDYAPVSEECRQAKLLNMWIEILIEDEIA